MTEVAKLSDIPDRGGLLVKFNGEEVALFRDGDRVFAIDAICPHAGGPLEEGEYDDGVVVCPLHGWEFDLATGTCKTTGEDHRCYEVAIEGDAVLLR